MYSAYKKHIIQTIALIGILFLVSGCEVSTGGKSNVDEKVDEEETFYWHISKWNECRGNCGPNNGTQTRTVTCDSASGMVVDDSLCDTTKPETIQPCTVNECSEFSEKAQSIVVKKTGQTQSFTDFDDGFYQTGVHRNYTRGSDIVIDYATGLQWQDNNNSEKRDWQEAIDYCETLSLGGYTDWKLPTIYELQTLIDSSRFNPAMDQAFERFEPYNLASHWSSTSDDHEDFAMGVKFFYGAIGANMMSYKGSVRCVRGGE